MASRLKQDSWNYSVPTSVPLTLKDSIQSSTNEPPPKPTYFSAWHTGHGPIHFSTTTILLFSMPVFYSWHGTGLALGAGSESLPSPFKMHMRERKNVPLFSEKINEHNLTKIWLFPYNYSGLTKTLLTFTAFREWKVWSFPVVGICWLTIISTPLHLRTCFIKNAYSVIFTLHSAVFCMSCKTFNYVVKSRW